MTLHTVRSAKDGFLSNSGFGWKSIDYGLLSVNSTDAASRATKSCFTMAQDDFSMSINREFSDRLSYEVFKDAWFERFTRKRVFLIRLC
jgi:hypothetical protein